MVALIFKGNLFGGLVTPEWCEIFLTKYTDSCRLIRIHHYIDRNVGDYFQLQSKSGGIGHFHYL